MSSKGQAPLDTETAGRLCRSWQNAWHRWAGQDLGLFVSPLIAVWLKIGPLFGCVKGKRNENQPPEGSQFCQTEKHKTRKHACRCVFLSLQPMSRRRCNKKLAGLAAPEAARRGFCSLEVVQAHRLRPSQSVDPGLEEATILIGFRLALLVWKDAQW